MGFAHFCFPLPTLREDAPQWGAVIPPRNAPSINKRRFASQSQNKKNKKNTCKIKNMKLF